MINKCVTQLLPPSKLQLFTWNIIVTKIIFVDAIKLTPSDFSYKNVCSGRWITKEAKF